MGTLFSDKPISTCFAIEPFGSTDLLHCTKLSIGSNTVDKLPQSLVHHPMALRLTNTQLHGLLCHSN